MPEPEPEQKSTRPTARVLRESFVAYFQRDGQEAALRLLDELAPITSPARSAAATSWGRTTTQSTAPKRSAPPVTFAKRRANCASRRKASRSREAATVARSGWRWRWSTPPPRCSGWRTHSTPLSPPTSPEPPMPVEAAQTPLSPVSARASSSGAARGTGGADLRRRARRHRPRALDRLPDVGGWSSRRRSASCDRHSKRWSTEPVTATGRTGGSRLPPATSSPTGASTTGATSPPSSTPPSRPRSAGRGVNGRGHG
jgi:hypothetical protein